MGKQGVRTVQVQASITSQKVVNLPPSEIATESSIELKDEFEIIEALIETNRQRVKTNEQIGREAQRLWDIEQERAKQRQKNAQAGRLNSLQNSQRLPVSLPEASVNDSTKGKSKDTRDKVGEKIGTSGKKAEHAKAVVDTIDDLKEESKQPFDWRKMKLDELKVIAKGIIEASHHKFEDKTFEVTDYLKEIAAMPPLAGEAKFTIHNFDRHQRLTINEIDPATWVIRCRDTGIRDLDNFQVYESENEILFVHHWRVGFFQPPNFCSK